MEREPNDKGNPRKSVIDKIMDLRIETAINDPFFDGYKAAIGDVLSLINEAIEDALKANAELDMEDCFREEMDQQRDKDTDEWEDLDNRLK